MARIPTVTLVHPDTDERVVVNAWDATAYQARGYRRVGEAMGDPEVRSEPSEILGPIDIELLKEGRFVRKVGGKLPTAKVAFLDEIFKSNSAILNVLLTIINERKFYQDGVPVPVRLKILFAATNEIPQHTELGALKDRFCLKAACR